MSLNGRDVSVLLMLAEGATNSEIADELGYAPDSMYVIVKGILHKLGARNRTHAVALAYHHGILQPKVPA